MKKLFLFILAISTVATAQKKDITLEEIWGGEFRQDYLNSLNSMNGDFYTLLNFDRATRSTSVDKYSYKTLEKVETIVNSNDLQQLNYFDSYEFNNDETKLILGTESEPIYRHSTLAYFYVYDINSQKLELVDEAKIQEPTFSPDSKKVAYVKDNNIFIKDFTTGKTTQVTTDGKKNKIINGITDWVYEEEFAFVRAFDWSADSKNIAFIRFDETDVPEFSMDIYGNKLYPTQQVFKYPKAGENNSVVSLHIYNLGKKETTKISLGDYEYIPRLKWSNDANKLTAITLNRHQNDLNLFFIDAATFDAKPVLHETDKAYIEVTDLNFEFLKDGSFVWTSDRSGYNHIYHYAKDGKLKKQITSGNWDVTKYYGYNEKLKRIYYQSVEDGSINRTVYNIKLNGKSKTKLSEKIGTNNASFSKNLNYFINNFSDATTPLEFDLYNAKGKKLKHVKDNKNLAKKLANYNIGTKEFFTVQTGETTLNAWMIKPKNFDPNKKYPLLMFQYSGPGSQQVANRWNSSNDFWYYMLASEGYIVACVDPRGTGYKGRDFKKVTYKELGKYEVIDQIASAKIFAKEDFIDENRIGIWGWSFGGFMSSNCLLKGNDVFKMAIAVAPVTSWRFYDSIYTERYMRTPQENPSGYDDNSPINFVNQMKGKYLLIHGSGDDNVHVQNTMRMINAMIEADVPYDSEIYPDRTHGIYRGKNTRLHLYKKMTNFVRQNL
ncbi:S9 family peptidase [Aureivirga marina]|uniref:S9 family peptidase n=1 Tax=Aureivirga marina TaxID=1182451 RepID=UPI0018CA3C88|nr:S9 family peptidase [Aureivirga marina]